MREYWSKFRKYLYIISSFIGILIPIFCFYLLPNINILSEPLSKFGIAEETRFIWMFFLQILSLLLYLSNLNSIEKIQKNINTFELTILTTINIISSVSLSLTGLIDMSIKYVHLGFAGVFFLAYTGFIFWWGFLNIKHNLKDAILSISISILILLSFFIIVKYMSFGYGISEVIFIILITYWNHKIS
jgi:hypothetical protein